MSGTSSRMSRRNVIRKGAGIAAATGLAAGTAGARPGQPARIDARTAIEQKVESTTVVDTHEHLLEEDVRLKGAHERIKSNDWSFLLSHYLDSDLTTSGMPRKTLDAFFAPAGDPLQKWTLLEPYWPRVRHTGYGQAVEIAMKRLYGIDRLSGSTVARVQQGYEQSLKPGMYRRVLQELGRIESCQVNSLESPFCESKQPLLLMSKTQNKSCILITTTGRAGRRTSIATRLYSYID
jgi:uncharacterized protein